MRPGPETTSAVDRPDDAAVDEAEPTTAPASTLDAVATLRRDVDGTRLPLPVPGVEKALDLRSRILAQLDDHLLPRLRALTAPGIAVVAGSTGAGKSTLVNSVLGQEVSAAGVLRPTTRQPVLAHNPADADLLAGHPVLDVVEVVAHPAVPRGLSLVDAPDLDSLLDSNREVAHRLLEAADLVLFVTTAARYGDAVPWETLGRALERGTSLAVVLNRVPRAAATEVRADLARRLKERGLHATPIFLVPDLGPHEGLLDPVHVTPVARWLDRVAGPDRARSVIARTRRGALTSLRPWVDELAEAVQAQVDAAAGLRALADDAVTVPADHAAFTAERGSLVTGPVRSRWAAASVGSGPLSGRWTARRGRTARVRRLAELADELRAAVTAGFAAARRAGVEAVTEALAATDLPGAAGLRTDINGTESAPGHGAPQVPPAVPSPERSAADWLSGAGRSVRDASDRRVSALVRGVGEDGAATLLALAAAGLAKAQDGLDAAVGREQARSLVDPVRADLVDRMTAQVRAATAPVHAALDTPDLATDAASLLRVRLAVLKKVR